jgi:HlyD family secretion protein
VNRATSKRINHSRLWIGATILLALAACAAGWLWLKGGDPLPQYRTARVTTGSLTNEVTASGQLNPVVKVLVGSQISGTIQRLCADFNSTVTNGQIIAQLDPATYQAAGHQNEGELAKARATLELAQFNARQARTLFEKRLTSESDYTAAMIALSQAQAECGIRQAALERSRVDLARCTIYSPVDGIVISRNVDVGQTVAANFTSPTLFEIANDLTRMQIDAYVSEADIGAVEPGQRVNFTVDAFPNRIWHGKVAQVRNAATMVQNVVTYDTVIDVENPELKLRPGMTANVSIVIAHRRDVMKIPNASFRYQPPEPSRPPPTPPPPSGQAIASPRQPSRGGNSPDTPDRKEGEAPDIAARTVYLLGDSGIPTPADIVIGISDSIFTEVIDGLKEGDAIIIGLAQQNSPTAADISRATNPISGTRRPPPR